LVEFTNARLELDITKKTKKLANIGETFPKKQIFLMFGSKNLTMTEELCDFASSTTCCLFFMSLH